MANTSFVQTDFRQGKWSPSAQGKMHDQRYKFALNVCNNGMPVFNGPWTRRPGFIWGGNTKGGRPGRLLDCFLKFAEPFQLELTDLILRAHVGNGFVFTTDTGVTIASISTAKPAVVTVNGTLPSTWAAFDTVTLDLNAPASAPVLTGRQFTIQSLTTTTFAIYDALTGLPIDGTTFAYTAPVRGPADQVFKILELGTPWSEAMLQQVRLVQTDTVAVMLHKSQPPQTLVVPPLGNFALSASAFQDGPYFDINTTSTTLTPNATSGNVTFTASSTTGINNGLGFVPSDVGRMLRFQSGPPTFNIGTTYHNGDFVTASDNNIYQSQVGSNVGHDPTTDNGVNWVITGQTIIWVWGFITTVTDATHVVVAIQPAAVVGRGGAQIPGDVLSSTNASASWQLGLYSGTTGYPRVGTYYEGRLLLAGDVVTNRFDASCSNAPFNFAPSAPDGTVGDGNALSEKSNAPKINSILWMLPTMQGVLCGGDNGEWIITASNFGDPLTPTSVQFHRVSTYGCSNIEAIQTELTTCFVQREQQRLLNYANYPYGEAAGWFADNLSENADDLCGPGIAEIRFQQEPSHFLWCRGNDGSLFGTTFEHAAYGKESYNGWHNHSIAGNRSVTSLSTGPSSDGLTTTLYVIAFNATSGYYEYLELGHVFDNSQPNWAQNFVDGLATPSAAQVYASGGNPAGINIYGLSEIIGQTVTLNMGGLDLGDFVVQGTDGHIQVPFTSTFTFAYFSGLSNGTNYGVYNLPTYALDTNTYNKFGMGAYSPTDGDTSIGSNAVLGVLVEPNQFTLGQTWFVTINVSGSGMRVWDAKRLTELAHANNNQLFFGENYSFGGGTTTMCYHPSNNCAYAAVIQNGSLSNSNPIARIDLSPNPGSTTPRLRVSGLFGETSNSFLAGPTGFGNPSNTIIPIISSASYVATAFITSALNNGGIGVFDGDQMTYVGHGTLSDAVALLCAGRPNTNVFYALGTASYGPASTTAFHTYVCTITGNIASGNALQISAATGTITPANVDATWTHFNGITGPAYDPTDGNIIVYATTSDAVTNQAYWVKINPNTGAIVWKVADTGQTALPNDSEHLSKMLMPNGAFSYYRGSSTPTLYTLNTATAGGSLSNVTGFPVTTDVLGKQTYWPEMQGVICNVEVIYTGSPPGPYDSGTLIPLGAFMQANNTYGPGWGLLTNAAPAASANWPPPDQFNVPLSIGANYTSSGQLLRPDFGQDAGAVAGPAFGKKRREHWFAAAVVKSQNFNISTDNTFSAAATDTVTVMDEDENVISQPNLYTGTLSTTMPDGYSWDSQIAWQITRPLPLTITAIGGFIATQDK